MKKKVKSLVFFTTALLLFHTVDAQLKLSSPNGFGNDIKKIVEDYPHHFSHVTGNLIMEHAQSADYQCNYAVTGAEESTITSYSSKNNSVYSWQAIMLTTEDFDAASKKFKALFGQLNNLVVSLDGTTNYHLKGEYESPREEMKFTSIVFSFNPEDEASKKLKAELALEFYAPMEWKVKVMIYDRDREDNERGKQVEQ